MAFVASEAPGTVRTYEAALRVIAPKVTAKLGAKVPPATSEDEFYSFWICCVVGA